MSVLSGSDLLPRQHQEGKVPRTVLQSQLWKLAAEKMLGVFTLVSPKFQCLVVVVVVFILGFVCFDFLLKVLERARPAQWAHACDPRTGEAEAAGMLMLTCVTNEIPSQPGQQSETVSKKK